MRLSCSASCVRHALHPWCAHFIAVWYFLMQARQ